MGGLQGPDLFPEWGFIADTGRAGRVSLPFGGQAQRRLGSWEGQERGGVLQSVTWETQL